MTRPIQLGSAGVITDFQSGVFAARSTFAVTLGSGGLHAGVAMGAVDIDFSGWFASNKFTPQAAGWYQVNAGVVPSGGLADGVFVDIALGFNGAVLASGIGRAAANVGNAGGGVASTIFVTVSSLLGFNGSTDYVQLVARELTSAGAQGTDTFLAWINGSRTSA